MDETYKPIRDPRLLTAVRERYGLGERFILYFGVFDVRKNVLRIVEAYARIRESFDEPYQLVLAGRLRYLGHPLYPDPRPLVRELADACDAALLPGREVHRLAFPFPFPRHNDFDAANRDRAVSWRAISNPATSSLARR